MENLQSAEEDLDYAEEQCGRVKALSEQVIVLTRERDEARADAEYWKGWAVRLTREGEGDGTGTVAQQRERRGTERVGAGRSAERGSVAQGRTHTGGERG